MLVASLTLSLFTTKMSLDIAKSPQGPKIAPSCESYLHGMLSHSYTVHYCCAAEMYRTLLDDSRIAISFYHYNFNGNSFCILPSHVILNYYFEVNGLTLFLLNFYQEIFFKWVLFYHISLGHQLKFSLPH